MLILSPGKEAMAPVCFVAHLDTVFPAGTFPDRLKEENGFLHGPGVVDCKGGIAVALLAMESLRKVGCPRSLRLLLTPDEEVSNRLSGMEGIRWIQDNSRGCAAAFVCECGTQGEAVTQRKGVLKAQVIIRGKSVHAGMFYDQGASAIREAAYKILQLEEHSEAGGITYNCGKIAEGKRKTVYRTLFFFGGHPFLYGGGKGQGNRTSGTNSQAMPCSGDFSLVEDTEPSFSHAP